MLKRICSFVIACRGFWKNLRGLMLCGSWCMACPTVLLGPHPTANSAPDSLNTVLICSISTSPSQKGTLTHNHGGLVVMFKISQMDPNGTTPLPTCQV